MTREQYHRAIELIRREYQAYLIKTFGYMDAKEVNTARQKIFNSWHPENCWALNT
jgi:hypothetical protein